MVGHIYAAAGFSVTGVLKPDESKKDWTHERFPPVLESYHYIRKGSFMSHLRASDKTIFLDSGAFSACMLGEEIDLDRYADFIIENQDHIHVASNLDVIARSPGLCSNIFNKTGKALSPTDPLDACRGSYEAFKRLEARGAKVAPVHHARDPDEWLQRYIDEGYEYIFLGGMVPENNAYLVPWLDRVWGRYLTNEDGTPKVKVHGFGLTSVPMMLRYPWYSCDSTSWINGGKFGQIFYTDDAGDELRLLIGATSPYRRILDKHYDTLSPVAQERVRQQVEARGFDIQELRTNYRKRWFYNLEYYLDLEAKIPDRFRHKQISFEDFYRDREKAPCSAPISNFGTTRSPGPNETLAAKAIA